MIKSGPSIRLFDLDVLLSLTYAVGKCILITSEIDTEFRYLSSSLITPFSSRFTG